MEQDPSAQRPRDAGGIQPSPAFPPQPCSSLLPYLAAGNLLHNFSSFALDAQIHSFLKRKEFRLSAFEQKVLLAVSYFEKGPAGV